MSEPPEQESTEVNPVADEESVIDGSPAKSATERFAARKALAEKLAAKKAAEAEDAAEEEATDEEPTEEDPAEASEEAPAAVEEPVDEPVADPVEEHVTGELKIEPEPEPEPVRDEEFESFGSGSLTGELPEPRIKLLAILAAAVLALDLLTKVVAVALLEDSAPIRLFGGALYLTFVRNPGAAFGLAEGMTWILALIAIGVVVFILWISRNLRSLGWAIGLGCVLGGAVGNLADRLFRAPAPMQGHVVDFLSLFDPYGRVWPVFNVADSAIVCGGALIVFMALRQHDYDGTVHKKKVSV
ncbi:signal peptidase II [Lentzea sp. NBRC 105346]|uniref:signal peptidase II n=1 Tax=Lentzea sp. NBRC 105346 TaxID=3032205 RepID=UPI0025530EEA|nr:signal peptidase II [Lentzea sp. NBRC 105346]